jgi:dethiobiotin synthetase
MSYFITGTDTAVGKTLISCALLHAFTNKGFRAVGMKPVSAGVDEDGVNEDVKKLAAASSVRANLAWTNPYSFTAAIAPHIAAEQENTRISIAHIVECYGGLASLADVVIVEGVGGFCVPLNDTEDSSTMAVQLGLPVILVVGMRLGCLNHALLTLHEIQRCGLECAGWIANVVDANMSALDENIDALQSRIDAPLLGVVKYQAGADAKVVAGALDLGLLKQRNA